MNTAAKVGVGVAGVTAVVLAYFGWKKFATPAAPVRLTSVEKFKMDGANPATKWGDQVKGWSEYTGQPYNAAFIESVNNTAISQGASHFAFKLYLAQPDWAPNDVPY